MRLDSIVVWFSGVPGPTAPRQPWRWHKRAPNGRILCQGESHGSYRDAMRAARRANLGCDYALSVQGDPQSSRITYLAQCVGGEYRVLLP